jgi:hypothetical protein
MSADEPVPQPPTRFFIVRASFSPNEAGARVPVFCDCLEAECSAGTELAAFITAIGMCATIEDRGIVPSPVMPMDVGFNESEMPFANFIRNAKAAADRVLRMQAMVSKAIDVAANTPPPKAQTH